MTQPDAWAELVEVDRLYWAKRMAMFAAGAEEQLRRGLTDVGGAPTALRVLRDSPIELTMDLFHPVFFWATQSNGLVRLARELVAKLDPGWLFVALPPLVRARLDSPEADYADYRRIAELLTEVDQIAVLADLVAKARTSVDPDILEVADEYEPIPPCRQTLGDSGGTRDP